MGQLLRRRGGHHGKFQIGAIGAVVEERELDAQFVAEVARDVLHHVRLGGGGWTDQSRRALDDRRYLRLRSLGLLRHGLSPCCVRAFTSALGGASSP